MSQPTPRFLPTLRAKQPEKCSFSGISIARPLQSRISYSVVGFNELLIPFLSASAKASSALEVAPDALNKEVLESFLKGSVVFLLALNALALFFFLVSIFAPKLLRLPGLSAALLFSWLKTAPQRLLKRKAAKAQATPAHSDSEQNEQTASADLLEGEEKAESLESPPPDNASLAPPEKASDSTSESLAEPPAVEALTEDQATVGSDENIETLEVEEEIAPPSVQNVVEEEVAAPPAEAEIEEESVDPNEVTEILTHAATPGEIIGTEAEASDPQLEAMVAAAAESAESATKEKQALTPTTDKAVEVQEETVIPTPEAQIEEEVSVTELEIEEEVASPSAEEQIEEKRLATSPTKDLSNDDTSSSAFEQKTEVLEKPEVSGLKLEEELEKALDAPIEETQEAPIFDVSLLDEQLEDDSKA